MGGKGAWRLSGATLSLISFALQGLFGLADPFPCLGKMIVRYLYQTFLHLIDDLCALTEFDRADHLPLTFCQSGLTLITPLPNVKIPKFRYVPGVVLCCCQPVCDLEYLLEICGSLCGVIS